MEEVFIGFVELIRSDRQFSSCMLSSFILLNRLFQFKYDIRGSRGGPLTLLMIIFGASSLHQLIVATPKDTRKKLRRWVFTKPGLSLNIRANNQKKVVQNIWQLNVFRKEKAVIWHDTINNSISPHSSNNYHPLTTAELIADLKILEPHIAAILYVQREGVPNIKEELCKTGILIIDIIKHLLPKRQAKNPILTRQYRQLHIGRFLEQRLSGKVLAHLRQLQDLRPRRNRRRNNLSLRRRITRQRQQSPENSGLTITILNP